MQFAIERESMTVESVDACVAVPTSSAPYRDTNSHRQYAPEVNSNHFKINHNRNEDGYLYQTAQKKSDGCGLYRHVDTTATAINF